MVMGLRSSTHDQLMPLLPTGCWGSLMHLTFAVTSPLTSNNLPEASVTAGSATFVTEVRKHQANDRRCAELGRVSIPPGVQRPSGLSHSLPPV